jgi:YVTN family beta-propeller protein
MRLAAFLALSLSLSGQTFLLGQSLKQVATIDLPGPKGERFDYLTIDPEDRYLLSGHLGPGILYVIDLRTNKLVKAIPGVPGITGLEFVPGLKKVYTSNWGENKIGVVDLNTMQVVKRLPTGEKPNGSTYAEPFGKVYVSDTDAKQVAIIDVRKDEIVKTLTFDSETGTPQYDKVSRKVYVNLRSVNQVAAVDPATDTVVGRYPVAGCEHNHGMALDPEGRRAFLLCGGNRTFTVLIWMPTRASRTFRFRPARTSSSSILACVEPMRHVPVAQLPWCRKTAPTASGNWKIFRFSPPFIALPSIP